MGNSPDGNAAMAQLVERVLGKDEVPGSNPGSSSKIPHTRVCGIFYFLFIFVKLTVAKTAMMYYNKSIIMELDKRKHAE